MFDKRISIFTGHFGSGKTELAVNYALNLAKDGFKTVITDLDVINPFFRTSDLADYLENKGIKVITPLNANTNVDVNTVPPEIYSIFDQKEYRAVLDVGGDDLGATVLSAYNREILEDDYQLFFVINTRRPETSTEEGILKILDEIQKASRLKVDWLVNNSNILRETTEEVILEGEKIIKNVSDRLSIPIAFTSGLENVLKSMENRNIETAGIKKMYIKKIIKLPWE
jgi:cellulose biosynthesis protein BcsQ